MLQSLDRIEASWRKRQSLFSGSGYVFTREQMLRFQQTCERFSEAYIDFADPLSSSRIELSRAQPYITKSTNLLADASKCVIHNSDCILSNPFQSTIIVESTALLVNSFVKPHLQRLARRALPRTRIAPPNAVRR